MDRLQLDRSFYKQIDDGCVCGSVKGIVILKRYVKEYVFPTCAFLSILFIFQKRFHYLFSITLLYIHSCASVTNVFQLMGDVLHRLESLSPEAQIYFG